MTWQIFGLEEKVVKLLTLLFFRGLIVFLASSKVENLWKIYSRHLYSFSFICWLEPSANYEVNKAVNLKR